jgi:hypothetical protein
MGRRRQKISTPTVSIKFDFEKEAPITLAGHFHLFPKSGDFA